MKVKGTKNSDGTYTILHEGIEFKAKRCTKCGHVRFLKHFHSDKSKKDGYMTVCSKCKADYKSLYNMYNSKSRYKEFGE